MRRPKRHAAVCLQAALLCPCAQNARHCPDAPVAQDIREADAVIFGAPGRQGGMCGEMRMFLDSLAPLQVERKGGGFGALKVISAHLAFLNVCACMRHAQARLWGGAKPQARTAACEQEQAPCDWCSRTCPETVNVYAARGLRLLHQYQRHPQILAAAARHDLCRTMCQLRGVSSSSGRLSVCICRVRWGAPSPAWEAMAEAMAVTRPSCRASTAASSSMAWWAHPVHSFGCSACICDARKAPCLTCMPCSMPQERVQERNHAECNAEGFLHTRWW